MRSAVAVALAVALVAMTGCLGGPVEGIDADISPDVESVETNETGDEILASSLNATEEADAYTVDSRHRFVAGASGVFDINFSMSSTGGFNPAEEEGVVTTDGKADFSFLILGNQTDFETTIYTEGETTHRRKVENGDETGWSERAVNFTQTESVLGTGAVEEAYGDADAELLGGETIEGVETYVLSLDVPPERVSRHSSAVISLHGAGLEERDENMEGSGEGEASIEELSAYLWVERDSRRPVRMAHFISMGGSEEGNASEDSENDRESAVDFLFEANWGYGDVEVEEPEAVSDGV